MDKKQAVDDEPKLTDAQIEFCTLYVYGDCEFAGQHIKCYREVFGEDTKNIAVASRKLLAKPQVQAKIKELLAGLQTETENIAVKLQVAETLKAVMEETSSAQFMDKFGISLSPAPLRAVSVNAAKALMELYPIRHVQESRMKIDGGTTGIVFNVIVPENKSDEEVKD
ncbi:hypothetical protein [Dysgonomonas sp. ZJ709]|uniref:hypothetical protein n=1 Tax=Dysgonomonas sp. ZJ709 TaxID=2709797 RepID=UPI0013EDFA57|nr:hypothetical protein [Dysgonomonas sp. ZJ709]